VWSLARDLSVLQVAWLGGLFQWYSGRMAGGVGAEKSVRGGVVHRTMDEFLANF